MRIVIDGSRHFNSAVIETDIAFTRAVIDMSLLSVTLNKPENLKSEITELEGKVGDLAELETTDKSSIVDALNEVSDGQDQFARGAGLQFAVNDGILSVTY